MHVYDSVKLMKTKKIRRVFEHYADDHFLKWKEFRETHVLPDLVEMRVSNRSELAEKYGLKDLTEKDSAHVNLTEPLQKPSKPEVS
jgi:hypothetical protein